MSTRACYGDKKAQYSTYFNINYNMKTPSSVEERAHQRTTQLVGLAQLPEDLQYLSFYTLIATHSVFMIQRFLFGNSATNSNPVLLDVLFCHYT